ncbi:acyl-CoA N-acyltransferase [Pyronema omphalodes]|nr:acyl-CoA N-acyltransferase [Pyronema omphalodes]
MAKTMSSTISWTTTIFSEKLGHRSDKVRVCGIEDYKACARSLAEAFYDDDVAFYFLDVPDNGGKTREELWPLHLEILEYIVCAHIHNGLVLSIGENHEGVALWMPPGKNMDDWYTIFRTGMWRLYFKLTAEGKKRYFGEFMEVLHQTKVNALGEQDNDAWYLVYIGVTPSARGRGYARKLVEHVTDKVDSEGGAPCYLESSHIRNVSMYQRFGFEKHSRVYLGEQTEKPVPLDIMIRPAMTYTKTGRRMSTVGYKLGSK